MRKTYLAWVAGVIDGEGCLSVNFQIHARTITPYFVIRVVLADFEENRRALKRLQRGLGGYVRNRNKQKSWKPGAHAQVEWGVRTKGNILIVKALLPYLVIKKSAAPSQ